MSSSRYRSVMMECKASTSWGIRSLSFFFNVTQNNGGPGTIDRYYGGQCSGVGVLSSLALDRVSSSKARLTCHFNTDIPVAGTSVYWLQVNQGTGIKLTTTRGMS